MRARLARLSLLFVRVRCWLVRRRRRARIIFYFQLHILLSTLLLYVFFSLWPVTETASRWLWRFIFISSSQKSLASKHTLSPFLSISRTRFFVLLTVGYVSGSTNRPSMPSSTTDVRQMITPHSIIVLHTGCDD